MNDLKTQCRNLRKSFGYAVRGIVFCLKRERNMRIHLCIGLDVLLFSFLQEFSRGERGLIVLIIGAVMGAECFNTALERTVDLAEKRKNPLAAQAKDIAAGGVLCLAIAAATAGIILFYPFTGFWILISSLPLTLLTLAILVLEGLFVFSCRGKE